MKLDIQVDSEAINDSVKAAIMESVLGSELQKAAKSAAETLVKGWPSALETASKHCAQRILEEEMRKPENMERIRAATMAYLTNDVLDKIVVEVFAKMTRGY